MLKVLFFARLKEELGCDALNLEWNPEQAQLADLQERLCREQGERWRDVLGQQNIIRAVNHTVVRDDHVLEDGDEVAFFPPVTGG